MIIAMDKEKKKQLGCTLRVILVKMKLFFFKFACEWRKEEWESNPRSKVTIEFVFPVVDFSKASDPRHPS